MADYTTLMRPTGWFEVAQVRGLIDTCKVAHHQVTLKVGFPMQEPG